MEREDFDPDEHDPTESTEVELLLTIEMYEFENDDGEWVEARWFVVENNLNDYRTVVRNEADVKRFWIDIAIELKRKAEGLWKK